MNILSRMTNMNGLTNMNYRRIIQMFYKRDGLNDLIIPRDQAVLKDV